MSKGWNRTQFTQEKLLASKIVKLFNAFVGYSISELWKDSDCVGSYSFNGILAICC